MQPSNPGTTLVLAVFCFLLPPLSLVASKAVVLLLFVALLGLAVTQWRAEGRLALPDFWSGTLLALLIGWCVIASAWSFEPLEAAGRALRAGVVMLAGLLLVRLASAVPAKQARQALRWLWFGLLLAVAMAAVELLFGHPILTGLKGHLENSYQELSRLNRGATALAILSWLAVAGLLLEGRKALAFASLLAVGLVLFFLESSAAKLAMGLGALALLVSFGHRLAGRALLVLSLAVLLFASPGIAKLLDQAGASEARGLQTTARERVYMWSFTADRIYEKPFFGWGFDASRDMPNFRCRSSFRSTPRQEQAKKLPGPPHSQQRPGPSPAQRRPADLPGAGIGRQLAFHAAAVALPASAWKACRAPPCLGPEPRSWRPSPSPPRPTGFGKTSGWH